MFMFKKYDRTAVLWVCANLQCDKTLKQAILLIVQNNNRFNEHNGFAKRVCVCGGGGGLQVVRWCWLNFQCRGVLLI